MRILMLSSTFPYPPTRGGTQVRTFNLLKYLSQHHEITLVTQPSPDVTPAEIEGLRQWVHHLELFPVSTEAPPDRGLMGKLKRFARFVWQGIPPHVLHLYSPHLQAWVDAAIAANQFDVITCEHSINEIYVRPEWRSRFCTVVNIHSSVYGTCLNQLQTETSDHPWRDWLSLPLLARYERQYVQKFSQIVVTTIDDQLQLQLFAPDQACPIIPNGVDLELFPPRSQDPGGQQLIFIGAMDNLANIDAARFLGLSVFPRIRQQFPAATLMLVGSRPTPEVEALSEQPGITVTGRVPAMVDYLHAATVCVIPMRTGFGIKNKTLEAMAAGVPVVASDRGLEGLNLDEPGRPPGALRANTVMEYVTAITRLFEDAELRRELTATSRAIIEAEFTWQRAGQRYEQVLLQEMRS